MLSITGGVGIGWSATVSIVLSSVSEGALSVDMSEVKGDSLSCLMSFFESWNSTESSHGDGAAGSIGVKSVGLPLSDIDN